MTNNFWPSDLPAPEVDGYQIQPQTPTIRTDMDQGPARQRRRFRSAPTLYQVKWVLTEPQLATFESWYHHVILQGASWFDVSLRNGQGMQTVEARFTAPWQASMMGGPHYEVSATLEVRNRPIAAWTRWEE